ncbi:hypothetical protein LX36DRAFT_658276 [Colletotrichum falcatum]|nr:hypothetical protein LX36DRAFT_658276 [Colletotrichum falcatum]
MNPLYIRLMPGWDGRVRCDPICVPTVVGPMGLVGFPGVDRYSPGVAGSGRWNGVDGGGQPSTRVD